jgi:putative nucleotidyltransferase with HDIG domain
MLPSKKTDKSNLVSIRTNSVILDRPLPYDLFLQLGGQLVHFRRLGDTLTSDRVKQLIHQGGENLLFIPHDQKRLHLQSLRDSMIDPDLKTEDKSRMLKEAAFIHVHDLFTQKEIKPVIDEARNLVEDMVSLVSTDMAAVSSLLNLSRHDYYTYNHSVDVAVYAIVLAKRVFGTDDKDLLIKAGLGGLLHDIGKRDIEIGLINKASDLTSDEWNLMRKHPEFGHEYVKDLSFVPPESKLVVLQHHENFDGTGYPFGVGGDDISRFARVVSIADVFDALTTKRSYHTAVNPLEAIAIMKGMQPGKFDPSIFKSFDKKFQSKPEVEIPKIFDPCHDVYSRIRKK